MDARAYWLAWSRIPGIGAIALQRIYNHFGCLAVAWEASGEELAAVSGLGGRTLEKVMSVRSQINPHQLLLDHLQDNPRFWTPVDQEYPRLLWEIAAPPPILYYRGQFCHKENSGEVPLVAIVGTRQPTPYGIRWTRQIAKTLVKHGFTIVSGLAEGIDTEAHTATLEVGGRTIAVLGTGVDVIYPAKNRTLYQNILQQGLVMSEYPAKTPPNRVNFPRRNRIIAGLCRAVIVIEAPSKSGALITAKDANESGRDVYVLPGRVDDYASQGCLRLLANGATPILSELDELIKMLGAIPTLDVPISSNSSSSKVVSPPPQPHLPPDLATIFAVVPVQPQSFDLIVQQTGLSPGMVSSSLLQLELMGLITQLPGMQYQRC